MNGGRNSNGQPVSPNRPRAQALASKADQGRYKIWLYAGNSEYPALLSRSNLGRPVIMRPVRTISRKDRGEERPDHVHGKARTSPESSETIRQTPVGTWGRYGPICVATCRGRQKCPAPSNYPILTFPFNKGRDQWRSLMSNKLPKVAKSLVG